LHNNCIRFVYDTDTRRIIFENNSVYNEKLIDFSGVSLALGIIIVTYYNSCTYHNNYYCNSQVIQLRVPYGVDSRTLHFIPVTVVPLTTTETRPQRLSKICRRLKTTSSKWWHLGWRRERAVARQIVCVRTRDDRSVYDTLGPATVVVGGRRGVPQYAWKIKNSSRQ